MSADRKTFNSRAHVLALPAPEDKPFAEYWHESVRGFGVRVMRRHATTGEVRRAYLARYVDAKGKDRKEVIGTVDSLRFQEAQGRAADKRENVRTAKLLGIREVPTLRQAFEVFLDAPRPRALSPVTVHVYRARFRYLRDVEGELLTGLTPTFWEQRYAKLRAPAGVVKRATGEGAVSEAMRPEAALLPRVKDRTPTAQGVLTLAKGIYAYYVKRGVITTCNPGSVVYVKSSSRTRLIAEGQMPAFWSYLHTRTHTAARDFLLAGLFTGWRESVLGRLRWSQVSVANRTYTLPADEIGNKSKVEAVLPIPQYLWEHVFAPRLAALDGAPVRSPWVIPSPKHDGQPLVSVRGTLEGLQKATGIRISDHDLRRTFATYGYKATHDYIVVSRLMTHRGQRINEALQTSGYVQTSDWDLRMASEAIAAYIVAKATAPAA
jgi:integrase